MSQIPQEELSGLIERITFHNPENGFCVLKVKARGHKDLVVVGGACAVVTAGEWVQAEGFWIQDRQYGATRGCVGKLSSTTRGPPVPSGEAKSLNKGRL